MAALTPNEHAAMDALADAWNAIYVVVAAGKDPAGIKRDLREIAAHIHRLQHAVMAQAAARLYPDKYRLLGSRFDGFVQKVTE